MAYTPKAVYTGQPGTTDTLLATVPAAKSWIVKQITVTNTTGTAATITLGMPAAAALAAANHMLTAVSVPANSVTVVDLSQVLATGETIRALQGTATALTVHISAVEFP